MRGVRVDNPTHKPGPVFNEMARVAYEAPINDADALPTDQPFYHKFDFVYCSMACLSAHRKAGYPKRAG